MGLRWEANKGFHPGGSGLTFLGCGQRVQGQAPVGAPSRAQLQLASSCGCVLDPLRDKHSRGTELLSRWATTLSSVSLLPLATGHPQGGKGGAGVFHSGCEAEVKTTGESGPGQVSPPALHRRRGNGLTRIARAPGAIAEHPDGRSQGHRLSLLSLWSSCAHPPEPQAAQLSTPSPHMHAWVPPKMGIY